MGNEAAIRISMEETAPAYVYETIETADTFAARIEHVTAARTNRLDARPTIRSNPSRKRSGQPLHANWAYLTSHSYPKSLPRGYSNSSMSGSPTSFTVILLAASAICLPWLC